METVGVYLKKEREAKNISLREVSQLTKISELYLDCIEKDDFAKLPQGPYIKGYISTYSRLIGGNLDETLKLYDSLYRKRNQTDEIPAEIAKDNDRNHPPGKPKTTVRKKSTTPPTGKIRSSFNAVATSVKAKSATLKATIPPLKTILIPFKKILSSLIAISSKLKASVSSLFLKVSSLKPTGAAIKTIGPAMQKKTDSLKTIVPIFKTITLGLTANHWLTHRRTWLYACIALFSAGLLVLAGFGFYHLFIYDEHPPIAAELPIVQDKDTRPLSAMGAEKKELFPLLSLPADQKRPLSLSTDPDEEVSRAASNAEKASSTSKSGNHASTPPPSSSLPAENTASNRTTAGTQSREPSGQNQTAVSPPPGATTAAINLRVLQASICSEIKNRMPAGVDTSFPSSVQRVYVWSQIEAKQIPSKIRHLYYFKGKKVSDVTLEVRSPNWRTWSYKDISNNRYRGEWRVDIASAGGKVLRRLYFEVR